MDQVAAKSDIRALKSNIQSLSSDLSSEMQSLSKVLSAHVDTRIDEVLNLLNLFMDQVSDEFRWVDERFQGVYNRLDKVEASQD